MIWSKAPKHNNFNAYRQIFSLQPEEQHKLNYTLAKRKIHAYA